MDKLMGIATIVDMPVIIDKYRQAGLVALANFEEAKLLRKECEKRRISVYVKRRVGGDDPQETLQLAGEEIIGTLDRLDEWVGTIPDQVVNALIVSKMDLTKTFILNVYDQNPDPILLFQFYSGSYWIQHSGVYNYFEKGELAYYMELAKWE